MSTVIGNLHAILGLDGSSFQRGLGDANAKMQTTMQSIVGIAKRASAAIGVALSLRELGRASDEWSDMSSRIGIAVGDMTQAAGMMQEMNRLARASYSSLGQTVDAFTANSGALRDLGFSTQGMLDYTEALNHALVITATRGQRAASVQNALSKAMAVGKLQTEGLETVLANGGRVAEALAAELGTNVSGLRDMASQGKITGDVIARALTGRLEELREQAGEMPATLADGLTLIGNSFTMLVGTMDKAFGSSEAIAGVLVTIADNFNTVAGMAAAAAIAIAVQYSPAIYGAVAATYTWVAGLVTLRGALLATGLGAFVVGAGLLIGKFLDLIQATGGFGSALKAMGDLGKLVWQALIDSAAAIPLALDAVWAKVRSGFMAMLRDLGVAWGQFVAGIGADLQSRRFSRLSVFRDMAEDMQIAGLEIQKNAYLTQDAIDELASTAEDAGERAAGVLSSAFAPVGEAWDALQKTIEDSPGSPSRLPGGDGGKGKKGGGGKSDAQKAADQAREAMEKLRKEHRDLQATIGMTAMQERIYHAVQDLGTGATAAQIAEVHRLIPAIDALTAAKERMAQVTQNGKQALENLFGTVIDGSKSAKNAVLDLVNQIARVQMMNAIFRIPGMGHLGQGLGGLLTPSIPGFATGVQHFRGGMATIHERGGELAIMPSGSTVIPHDLSKRMADNAMDHSSSTHHSIGFDPSVGELTATMYDIAGNVVASARRKIVGDAVSATGRAMKTTKAYGGRL